MSEVRNGKQKEPKYIYLGIFMAVRNCINILILYGLEVLHCHIPYIRTFYVYVRNNILGVTKRTRSTANILVAPKMSTVR